ncbi:MAG: DUF47 family protein [Candidatus Hadarchaeales archaeon]
MRSGPIAWLGRGREKEILRLCETHMQKICSVVISLNETMENFQKGNLQGSRSSYRTSFEKEKEADEIKRKILVELYGKVIHPLDQEHLVRLILTADDIAANAKAAAMKIGTLADPKKIPPNLRKLMLNVSENLVGMVMKTYDALKLLRKDRESAIAVANEIEKTEELIDDFRIKKILPELLEWSRKCQDIGQYLLVKEIIDNMENVADRCEDVADIIRFIALSL